MELNIQGPMNCSLYSSYAIWKMSDKNVNILLGRFFHNTIQ